MPCADRDDFIAHPCDLVDAADAFIAGIEGGCACALIDAPDVQEAVVSTT